MPKTLTQTLPKFRQNKYFVHRLGNGNILLITELGRFTALTTQEFAQFQKGNISQNLFQKLEQGHIIATDQNKPSMAGDYRIRYGHVSQGISLHIVNPTMRCNQTCLYCYANSSPLNATGFDLNEQTAKKVLDFIWQSPGKDITIEFQGGEPLANFPIIEFFINQAKEKKGKNVHWRIVSNLTMMDETIASFLQKNQIFDLCTSLDGPKKVHDSNRPWARGSSHAKVVQWLNCLKQDYGFKAIGALCTVTKNSLPYPKEIVDAYLELGLPDITAVPLRKIGLAARNWEKIGYTAKEYLAFWEETVDYCIKLSKEGRTVSEQTAALTMVKMNRFEPDHHTCYSKPCGAALMQCSYQPDGSIFTCDEAKAESMFKIGNVNQTYKQVFTSPEALNIVSLSSSLGFACNECKFTGFCHFCPLLSYSTQKSLVPMLALDSECQTKKAQFEFLLEKLFSKDAKILQKWLCQKN